jgi:hypothetical protein
MPPSFEPREVKGSTGPTVSIVIILLIMIAGAVYFWYARQEQKTDVVPIIPAGTSTTPTQ